VAREGVGVMITVGIDVGSICTKAAWVKDGVLMSTHMAATGYNAKNAGKKIFEKILGQNGIDASSIEQIVATGYGRISVTVAHRNITEITCHAAGAHYLNPEIRTVIDIGGQDSKVISLDRSGNVKDFAMNDKCAAGTGRFLEVMAKALEVDLDDFGGISVNAKAPAIISSMCTVFAESEVISLIAQGERRANIIAGIHDSVCSRVAAMAGRMGIIPPVMMAGGVAKNVGVVQALERKIKLPIDVSEYAQVNGAIGAALLAGK
jgi:(R)-2-hydroxyacyl-CoA dehydratese activating ATPase